MKPESNELASERGRLPEPDIHPVISMERNFVQFSHAAAFPSPSKQVPLHS